MVHKITYYINQETASKMQLEKNNRAENTTSLKYRELSMWKGIRGNNSNNGVQDHKLHITRKRNQQAKITARKKPTPVEQCELRIEKDLSSR